MKLKEKKPELKEKTQNSRKKLIVWEALASYVYPSGVIKKACIKCYKLWSSSSFQVLTSKNYAFAVRPGPKYVSLFHIRDERLKENMLENRPG